MNLLPQFQDMQVCSICGAPAEILGEPWTRNGQPDWFRSPMEFKCSPHATGAQERKREVPDGRRTKEITYYVRVYTHICTRNAYEDAEGNPSDAKEHRYACGALQSGLTRKVPVDSLPDRCFASPASERIPDTAELAHRWSA